MKNHLDLLDKHETLWPNTAPLNSENLVWRVADERWGHTMHISRHNTDTLLIGFVLEGSIRMLAGNEPLLVAPNQVLLADQRLASLRVEQTPAHLYLIETSSDGIALAQAIWGQAWLRIAPRDTMRIRQLFERALAEAACQRLRCRQQTTLISRQILLALEEEHAEHGIDQQRQCFERCRQIIHDRYSSLRTATDVAAACGYSPEHLTRLFRHYQNTGVYEYLISLKISACCLELTRGNKTVAAVAEEFGFTTPYSFSRTFKRMMGMRPGAYRNTQKP